MAGETEHQSKEGVSDGDLNIELCFSPNIFSRSYHQNVPTTTTRSYVSMLARLKSNDKFPSNILKVY